MNENLVQARGLVRSYASGTRRVEAVRGVDLDVAAGEWVAVMGPSGCGKSTLLHLLGGLDVPDAGEVSIAGEQVTGRSEGERAVLRRRLVGYVFQAYNLVPDLTVAENIELPAQLAGCSRREARQRAAELLAELGLDDVGERRPRRAVRRPAAARRPRPRPRQPPAAAAGRRAHRRPRHRVGRRRAGAAAALPRRRPGDRARHPRPPRRRRRRPRARHAGRHDPRRAPARVVQRARRCSATSSPSSRCDGRRRDSASPSPASAAAASARCSCSSS